MGWSLRSSTEALKGKPKSNAGNGGNFDERNGTFHMAWEDKSALGPQPGAQAYAYESLALFEQTPIGPSVVYNGNMIATAKPMFAGQAVALQGIPLQSGALSSAPLFDPDTETGYNSLYPSKINPLVAFNLPVSQPEELAPNTPYPGSGQR